MKVWKIYLFETICVVYLKRDCKKYFCHYRTKWFLMIIIKYDHKKSILINIWCENHFLTLTNLFVCKSYILYFKSFKLIYKPSTNWSSYIFEIDEGMRNQNLLWHETVLDWICVCWISTRKGGYYALKHFSSWRSVL